MHPSGLRLPRTRLLQAPAHPPRAAANGRCARFARRFSRRRSSRRDFLCAESALQRPTGRPPARSLPTSSNLSYRPSLLRSCASRGPTNHTNRKFCNSVSSFLKQFLRDDEGIRIKTRRSGEDPANTCMDNLRALFNESGIFCSDPMKTHQKTSPNWSRSESALFSTKHRPQ